MNIKNIVKVMNFHSLLRVDKAKKDSPNVLFILMDDLGYGDVSLNGAIYDTPNIDSIGENGLNFENFYSSYSVCSPARFAGLYQKQDLRLLVPGQQNMESFTGITLCLRTGPCRI